MEIYNNKHNEEEFLNNYSAYFGKLLPGDGQKIYLNWVIKCDIEILKEAIKTIAKTWNKRDGKPRLQELQNAYNSIVRDRKEFNTPAKEEQYFCDLCRNSGQAIILWAGDDTCTKFNWKTGKNPHGMRIVKDLSDGYSYRKESLTYCACKKGRQKFERDQSKGCARAESWQAILDLDRMGYLKPLNIQQISTESGLSPTKPENTAKGIGPCF